MAKQVSMKSNSQGVDHEEIGIEGVNDSDDDIEANGYNVRHENNESDDDEGAQDES